MTLVIADRVQEVTSTSFAGTGAIQLNGVPTNPAGRISFASAVGNGNETVFLVDDNAGNWEISIGTLTVGSPDALSRDTVIASSAGGAKVNFTSGTKDVKVVATAQKLAMRDDGGHLIDGNGNAVLRDQYLTDTGVADAYVVAPNPPIEAYQSGQVLRVNVANANTGAATLNVNGLGVKSIKLADGTTDPGAGDIAAGLVSVLYDGTNFRMLSGSGRGKLLQSLEATYSTYASTTSTIPYDDTIPQNTEGVEILTQSITPSSASNKIRCRVEGYFSMNIQHALAIALFKDSAPNALAYGFRVETGGLPGLLAFEYQESAGNTNARTYKVRWGPGSGTGYINGNNVTRRGGGTAATRLIVEEIRA